MTNIFSDYISLDQLIDEISDTLSPYEDTGKITEANIIRFVMDRLRVFGNNIMEEYEDLVEITNHVGDLPINLYRLNSIMMCQKCERPPLVEPCKDWTEEEIEELRNRPNLYRRNLYKWVETNKYEETYNECNDCDREINETLGVKSEIIPDILRVRLKCPTYLSFGKGILRGSCTDNCRSCCDPHSKHMVDIIENSKLRCSFPDGTLYVNYYGIPIDEDNRPLIVNSQKGYIYEYLTYYVIYKLLQQIIIKDTSAIQLYREFDQLQRESFRKAVVDSKASTFTADAYINIHNENRRRSEKYFKTGFQQRLNLAHNNRGIQPRYECGSKCYRDKRYS